MYVVLRIAVDGPERYETCYDIRGANTGVCILGLAEHVRASERCYLLANKLILFAVTASHLWSDLNFSCLGCP